MEIDRTYRISATAGRIVPAVPVEIARDVPVGDRPGRPGRPGSGNGINVGDINIGNNNIISNRPSWVNIDNDRITNINNRWQNQIGGIQNWRGRYPDRGRYWNDWGNGVRHHWQLSPP